MKKRLLIFVFLAFFIECFFAKNVITILPFKNASNSSIDYVGEFIQNTFYVYFSYITDYSTIPKEKITEYLKAKNIKLSTLQNQETSQFDMADYFNSFFLIRGQYYKKNDSIVLEYEIINNIDKKIVLSDKKIIASEISIFIDIETIVNNLTEEFKKDQFRFGYVFVDGEEQCDIYVNSKFYGNTPKNIALLTGNYEIKLFYRYNDEYINIITKTIEIKKNDKQTLNVQVFTNIIVETEEKCQLLLDNKEIGFTPIQHKVIINKKYGLNLRYVNKNNEIYQIKKEILIDSTNDIVKKIESTATLQIIGNPNLTVSLNDENKSNLNLNLDDLKKGKYSVKVFLDDKKWKKKYHFYKEDIHLNPFEIKKIDLSNIKYKKQIGFCFIPSLSQFYNKEYAKGSVILSNFILSFTAGAFSPLVAYLLYQNYYLPKANLWNEKGLQSGFSPDEIQTSYNTTFYLFFGLLGGGFGIAFFFWLYSLIDGLIISNRIDFLLNKNKISLDRHIKVKFDINFIF